MDTSRFNWKAPLKSGLIGGIVAIMLALVGLVEAFGARDIIGGVITMGQTLLVLSFVMAGYTAARSVAQAQAGASGQAGQLSPGATLSSGALAGLVTAGMLAGLVLLGPAINLRAMFIKASPALYHIITLGLDGTPGLIALLVAGAVIGALAAGLDLLPAHIRRALVLTFSLVIGIGLLEGLLKVMFLGWGFLGQLLMWMFASRGLSIPGALAVLIVVGGGQLVWRAHGEQIKQRLAGNLPSAAQRQLYWGGWGALGVLALALPFIIGSYPSEVMDEVGRFALMGLGLNIVVGFAGLLDLGYVAFFAIGAYVMGVLTSPEITFLPFRLTFWAALPFAIGTALLAGVLLGVPVLGMRGDYLAIVTLGFGEIIRLVALSDWLKPFIGGSNGITRIPKAVVGPLELATPQTIYYLFLLSCVVAGFVSIRLKDSRLGRAWMAMREDEDVAEAVGIQLVSTKLLAFATGAAFSGLAGAIFASKLTSIYPHSFHLLISINALCLIIVGGIGSIPGVLVGALILVGVPELLREFQEYRLLAYGAFLVIMMLTRPEGILPEATHQREFHKEAAEGEAAPAGAANT